MPKRTTRTPVLSVLSPELLREVYSHKHTRQYSAASGVSYDERKPSTASDMIGLGISDNLGHVGMSYSLRKGSHQSSIFQSSLRRPSDNASIMSSAASPKSYHYRSRSSPISFTSEGYYTPNLDEATAISLYPHHNTSLLLVQQQGLSGQRVLPGIDQLNSSPSGRPTITIDLPANDFDYVTHDFRASVHDSEHERKRETPPSFQLIPPTPGDERASGILSAVDPIDGYSTSGTQATAYTPPTRQSSLFKRARAYSSSTIQPFLSRTFSNSGSVQRTTSRRRKLFDSGARLSGSVVDNEADRPQNLHPFWQPRDFWDGLEEEEQHEGEAEPATRKVTNDNTKQNLQQQTPTTSWRRGGSLRFLIGNSLGIDRQPTNRRLPMVRWPSHKTTDRKKSRVFVHGHTLRTVRSVTVLGRMRQSLARGGRKRRGSKSRTRRGRWEKGLRCGFGR